MPSSASKHRAREPHPPGVEQVARHASEFQRREWKVQRVGWVVLALFVLAGLTGLFGAGPLAEAQLRGPAGTLDYQRFVRRHADARWQLALRDLQPGGEAEIAIDAAFASNFKIMNIHPEPSGAAVSGGRWIYRFEVGGDGEALVVFDLQPLHVGRHEGTISVNDAPPFSLWQLTYP